MRSFARSVAVFDHVRDMNCGSAVPASPHSDLDCVGFCEVACTPNQFDVLKWRTCLQKLTKHCTVSSFVFVSNAVNDRRNVSDTACASVDKRAIQLTSHTKVAPDTVAEGSVGFR